MLPGENATASAVSGEAILGSAAERVRSVAAISLPHQPDEVLEDVAMVPGAACGPQIARC